MPGRGFPNKSLHRYGRLHRDGVRPRTRRAFGDGHEQLFKTLYFVASNLPNGEEIWKLHGEDVQALELVENSDFVVEEWRDVVIPLLPSTLTVTYTDLDFATTDTDSINDAFEIALVDDAGRPLVPTITGGRDAFFNLK